MAVSCEAVYATLKVRVSQSGGRVWSVEAMRVCPIERVRFPDNARLEAIDILLSNLLASRNSWGREAEIVRWIAGAV